MIGTIRRNRPVLVALAIVLLILVWMMRRYEPGVMASILLSGLTLGALYFLVASGLSLIFGLMDVLNFAHGIVFMIGAYIGYTSFANPRLVLNLVPFVLALFGALELGRILARVLQARVIPDRLRSGRAEVVLRVALWLVAAFLLFLATAGFNVMALAAKSAISSGGAVATAAAQEPAGVFLRRILLMAAAGLLLGLATARAGHAPPNEQPNRRLALGLLLAALAFLLVPLRTGGEEFVLGLSSDLRFVVALVVGALAGTGLGALIEVTVIRPLYGRPVSQLLLTLGLSFALTELVKGIWGTSGFFMEMPKFFDSGNADCPSSSLIAWFSDHCSSINVLGRFFPSYRMFIIVVGLAMFLGILLLLQRTRLGIIIRAGVQDSEMVQALGINVRRIFTLVFALGTGLAAVGGVVAAPVLGINLGLGNEVQLQGFIAVVIGGMGSLPGAAVGALLVGLARAFGDQLVLSGITLPGMESAMRLSPAIARASTVLVMAIVLLLRPAGLFGKRD